MSEAKLTVAEVDALERRICDQLRGARETRQLTDSVLVHGPTVLSLIAAARELEARWIPVTERKPERGESNLLFLSRTSTVRQGFRTSGVLYFLDDGDPATGVTHWMPLPKGPTK